MSDQATTSSDPIDQMFEHDAPDNLPDNVSKTTLHNFPLSMVLADPNKDDCPIIYVNRAFVRMTGYAPSAVVGRNCRFLQGKDTRASDRKAIQKALETESQITIDVMNYRADGKPFVNRLMIAPLYDDTTNELIYFLGVQTEKSSYTSYADRAKRLGLQLQELQHRVKNHLSMILSSMRIEMRERPPEEVVGLISRRVETLSLLYHEFAEHADPEDSGKIDLGVYFSRIASTVHGLESKPEVLLSINPMHVMTPIAIAAPAGLLVSEILTNAFQHGFEMTERGSVELGLSVKDNKAVLTVADDGIGMPDGAWPNDDSTGGRITRALIEQIDGQLEIDSSDRGTIITVTFPIG